ncbi:MAG: adenylyl-sulfate kinase [Myxococcota bacterium]|nr:adenylyl-sulfate kinase [Myxococcota bacterium]
MSGPASDNIVWHAAEVTEADRRAVLGSGGAVVWFTGLSGSGKSTVARRVERLLLERGVHAYGVDGDNIRHRLNKDLTFAPEDRKENIRRVGEVCALFADACVVALASFISPYAADRARVRSMVPVGRFIEVFVDAPLSTCEERDPKGLYAKARAGSIPNFTGISAPYEAPEAPELRLATAGRSVDDCAREVVTLLMNRGIIPDASD